VPGLVGKAHDLVLKTRAITRPHALDLARIHRGAVEIFAYDGRRLVRRVGHPARKRAGAREPAKPVARSPVFHMEQPGIGSGIVKRKKSRPRIARLLLHARKIERAPEDTRRRAGLEAPEFDATFAQAVGERARAEIPQPAALILISPDVHQALKKGAGCQDHRPPTKFDIQIRPAPHYPTRLV